MNPTFALNFSSSTRLLSFCVLVFSAISVTTAGAATVIFDNGSPLLAPAIAQGALFADANNANFSAAADNFTLKANLNVIRDIHWWGVYGSASKSPPADAFSITIYNDNAGAPGTVNTLVSTSNLVRTATSDTITGLTMYKYDTDVAAVSLTAGTTYWLGISNNSGGNNWAWVQSKNSGGNAKQFSLSNGTWGNSTKELAFNLTVPEPSALMLAGIGGLALLAGGNRRMWR